MKSFIFKYALPAALLLLCAGVTGCDDKWDDHYETTVPGSDKTIYAAISENPDLSVFKTMIDKAGFAEMLNTSQTFTVWAPENSALAGIDLDDEALVRRTVLNHIARYNKSTSTSPLEGVRMYNNKKFFFEDNSFAGVQFLVPDQLCSNGVLHTMKGMIPYTYNIREYIDTHSETSKLAAFLARFDEKLFDVANSTPIDVNESGETIYDSVFINRNLILDYPFRGIGPVANEDSTFTMIVPTDAAWQEAYDKIKPWFVTASDSITDVQTSLAIFSNMIFRENIVSPAGLKKLVSTTGCEYLSAPAIFSGASYMRASNGSLWITPRGGDDALESWNKKIEIEGEDGYLRKMLSTTNSYGNTIDVPSDHEFADSISEMSYIYVSSSTLDNAGAEFTINNVLSGKYKIYAYFVPAIVDNESATGEITKLRFSVTYPRSATSSRTTTVNYTNSNFVTSATYMTEIYVGEVTFPSSNFVDRLRLMDDSYDATADASKCRITVRTDVNQSDFNAGRYSRSFRLDRIVFVPVI